jgi:hypothetical protein
MPWFANAGRTFRCNSARRKLPESGHWLEDKAPQLGAALAYYTVFSLAPMVLVLLAVFGLIYGNSEVARREILHQLYAFLDKSPTRKSCGNKACRYGHDRSAIVEVYFAVFRGRKGI